MRRFGSASSRWSLTALLRAAPLTAVAAVAVAAVALRWSSFRASRAAREASARAAVASQPASGDGAPTDSLAAPPLAASASLAARAAVAEAASKARALAAAAAGDGGADAGADAGSGRDGGGGGDAASSAPLTARAHAWMLHGDVHHTHRAPGLGPDKPKVVWKVDVGGPVEAQVTTSPDARTLYVASLGGTLTALARSGGAVAWKLALGDRAYATPAVAPDGTIYAGSDAKRLFAVTPAGTVKWKLETEGDCDTSPLVTSKGNVVVAAGRTLFDVRPGGDVAWRFQAKAKIFTSPALTDEGLVVFGAQDHRAYAIVEATGKLAWSTDLGADVDGSPAIGDDGAVFFGNDGGAVVRLAPASGDVVWRAELGGFVRGALSIGRDGDVLAGVYGPLPRQVRVAAATGRVLGAFSVQGTGAREFGVHGGALEDDAGTLYFGAQDDAVYAIARDGAVRWRFATGGDVDAPLTLLDDALVVPSDDGTVYLLGR